MYYRNIGFDIDGVLNNIEQFQLEEGLKYFKKKYLKKYNREHRVKLSYYDVKDEDVIKDKNGYGIREIFGCSKGQEAIFWALNTLKFAKQPAKKYATEMVQKLYAKGDKVYIVTSRGLTTKKDILGFIMRHIVKKWLKENGIKYEKIIFCSEENSAEEKVAACKEYNLSLFLEDKKENAVPLSEVTKVILMTTRNNIGLSGENIIRADDLYTAYAISQELRFNFLSREERENLSKEDLIEYYKKLKDFYMSLPYDTEMAHKYEEQCESTVNKFLKLIRIMYKPRMLNKHLLPKEKGVIIASNHLHSFDPLLKVNFMNVKSFKLLAKAELLKQKVGSLFVHIGSIFVDNDDENSKKDAREEMIKSLLHDENVIQYPEGHRNTKPDKFLQDFEYGVVDTALKSGKPIYPFAVNDNYIPGGNTLLSNVGNPIYVNPGDNLTEKLTELRDAIATLLWEIMEKELSEDVSESQRKLWELYERVNCIDPEKQETQKQRHLKSNIFNRVHQEQ